MAVCLLCGCSSARSLVARTARVERVDIQAGTRIIRRECRRIVQCPEPPRGCGSRGVQTICDDGPTERTWLPAWDAIDPDRDPR